MVPMAYSPFLLLAFLITLVPVSGRGNGAGVHRQKREWILAPRQLFENHDYTTYDYIAKIRSDKENFTRVIYSVIGPGVDEEPRNRFGVDAKTGFVKVFTILDREDIPVYHLKGIAKFTNGTRAENDIDLMIKVVDENDCPPVIKIQQVGYVNESSAEGTVIMKVIATDADEINTLHSKISYKIESRSNAAGMFYMNSRTGEVMVRSTTLDREKQDTYKLTIVVSDLDGRPGGNKGTGEIEIKITDINDNIPTLEKEWYEGSVEENTVGVEVMRIKAIDMDLIHTDNWLAVYEIISGNEAGYFSIKTDSVTNEGIIMIEKALDYEEVKTLNLELRVSNKAKYSFGSSSFHPGISSKPYPIKINVINQKEGPRFQPNVKVVTVSEDRATISINKVITTYAAIDSDTLMTATNVRYAKLVDLDNWISIDEKTAEIRLNKLPDRESIYLKNGTYYAKIICITEETPSKTATGTIAIQVEDFNDHCPQLTATHQTVCLGENVVYVTAVDGDEFPNGAPFDFTVIQESRKKEWTVEPLNGTAVILRHQAHLWPGIYKVKVDIKDQQGKSCDDIQTIDVVVCTCDENIRSCVLRGKRTATFGAAGVLLLLLGLLLLLLIPLLLLFCLCGAAAREFKPIPFEPQTNLISYHTEGQGEDRKVPLLQIPTEVDGGTVTLQDINKFEGKGHLGGLAESGGVGGGRVDGADAFGTTVTAENMHLYNQYGHFIGRDDMQYMGQGTMLGQHSDYIGGAFDGMALSEHFLGEYYLTKSNIASQQYSGNDRALAYDYEGQESLAGSVGCCSLLDNDEDLAFLNDLGPKFKTLAAICKGSTLVSESAAAEVRMSSPPVRPVSPARPSTSTHTHVHTHSEAVRDGGQLNTFKASNVASESSTFIQEERITERSQASVSAPKVHVQDNVIIPNPTILIQQPAMYYAATPMYVVEAKPQMVLVSGETSQAVGQVGQVGMSQGLVQVGTLQGSQGVMLVDGQVGMGGAAGQVAQGVSKGTISRSTQVLVVENGSSGREQGKNLVEGQRSAEAAMDMRGHGGQMKSFVQSSHGSTGSHEGSALASASKSIGSRRVVSHKKISVTERSFEPNTRA